MLRYVLVSDTTPSETCSDTDIIMMMTGGRQVEVTFVGDLGNTEHDVSGKVYILDENTLVIDQFSYDGNGFGVYINVATRGKNLKAFAKNRIDIAFPSGSEGKPIDEEYTGDGQLIIDLT